MAGELDMRINFADYYVHHNITTPRINPNNKTGVLPGETDWVRSPNLPAANRSRYEHPP